MGNAISSFSSVLPTVDSDSNVSVKDNDLLLISNPMHSFVSPESEPGRNMDNMIPVGDSLKNNNNDNRDAIETELVVQLLKLGLERKYPYDHSKIDSSMDDPQLEVEEGCVPYLGPGPVPDNFGFSFGASDGSSCADSQESDDEEENHSEKARKTLEKTPLFDSEQNPVRDDCGWPVYEEDIEQYFGSTSLQLSKSYPDTDWENLRVARQFRDLDEQWWGDKQLREHKRHDDIVHVNHTKRKNAYWDNVLELRARVNAQAKARRDARCRDDKEFWEQLNIDLHRPVPSDDVQQRIDNTMAQLSHLITNFRQKRSADIKNVLYHLESQTSILKENMSKATVLLTEFGGRYSMEKKDKDQLDAALQTAAVCLRNLQDETTKREDVIYELCQVVQEVNNALQLIDGVIGFLEKEKGQIRMGSAVPTQTKNISRKKSEGKAEEEDGEEWREERRKRPSACHENHDDLGTQKGSSRPSIIATTIPAPTGVPSGVQPISATPSVTPTPITHIAAPASPMLDEAMQRFEELQQHWHRYEAASVGLSRAEREVLNKEMRPLNLFSAESRSHNRDCLQKLMNFLSGRGLTSNAQHAYIKCRLSEQVVSLAHDKQVSFSSIYASFTVCVWEFDSEMVPLILYQIYRTCPFLVPVLPVQKPGQSELDYLVSIGYTIRSNGTIEGLESFLKRMKNIAFLYGQLLAMSGKNGRMMLPPQMAWQCLVALVTCPPISGLTASIINGFLRGASQMLQKVYAVQFRKCLEFIHTKVIADLEDVTQHDKKGMQALIELKIALATLAKTGNMGVDVKNEFYS